MDHEAHPMKAKRLEAILAYEGKRTGAEMVQRFQKLRDNNLLPVSRGRNAEHISVEGIVSGLLAMVAEKPGFAGLKTIVLRNLRPVGGEEKSFAKAPTFGQAFRSALEDSKLLETIREIRVTDDEIYTNSNGRASIFYIENGEERAAYYVGHTALTVISPGGEKGFDPRAHDSALLRELSFQPRFLRHIMSEYREQERWAKLMEDLDARYGKIDDNS